MSIKTYLASILMVLPWVSWAASYRVEADTIFRDLETRETNQVKTVTFIGSDISRGFVFEREGIREAVFQEGDFTVARRASGTPLLQMDLETAIYLEESHLSGIDSFLLLQRLLSGENTTGRPVRVELSENPGDSNQFYARIVHDRIPVAGGYFFETVKEVTRDGDSLHLTSFPIRDDGLKSSGFEATYTGLSSEPAGLPKSIEVKYFDLPDDSDDLRLARTLQSTLSYTPIPSGTSVRQAWEEETSELAEYIPPPSPVSYRDVDRPGRIGSSLSVYYLIGGLLLGTGLLFWIWGRFRGS